LIYDGSEINEFIPIDYPGRVNVLEEREWKPEFEKLEDRLDHVFQNPLGYDQSFQEIITQNYGVNNKILLLIDDNTRPNVHTKILLPLLIPQLYRWGVDREDIHILFTSGTHRPPTEKEQKEILGPEIWEEVRGRLHAHDCDSGCVDTGMESSQGTPIIINEHLLTADIVVPVTDSELHYFAGVAGTVKSLIPGIAHRTTINKNHVKIFDPELGFNPGCRLGNIEGNPMINEIEEMAGKISSKIPIFGIDAIFSLRSEKIIYLNAGDLIKLHEEAAKRVASYRKVKMDEPANLVIISSKQLGLNLYQTGKAIHAAWHATKKGGEGKMIVLASCRDGVGNDPYLKTMHECTNMSLKKAMKYALENYCTEETFRIGNQKPIDVFRILMSIGEGNIQFITEMDHELMKNPLRMNPIEKRRGENARDALRRVIDDYISKAEYPNIHVIPDPGILITQK
jgi:nickel-dependent lactate racemase